MNAIDVIINIALKNVNAFSLTMFGVLITIFTVIYSFIVSKKNYYDTISEEHRCRLEDSSFIELEKQYSFHYISNLKSINLYVLVLSFMSLGLYIFSFFIDDKMINKSYTTVQYVYGFVVFIYFIAIIFLLIKYIFNYFREVEM